MRFLTALMLMLVVSGPAYADNEFIVNIDNPNFRKLVVAIPPFEIPKDAPDDVKKVGEQAADELGRLLSFSGLFNILASAAYKDIKPKEVPAGKEANGMEDIDVIQWRAIGVESLTMGKIEPEPGGSLTITLKTADINRSRLVLGKRYRQVTSDQISKVMRRYADLILQAYTGKPGIFDTKFVFIGRRKKENNKHVFVCDFDGSNVRQITKGNTTHLSPTWSPDGKFITYTSYKDNNPDLYIHELATGKTRKLSGEKGLNSGSNWSHNGKVVAFTGSNAGDTDIFSVLPDGSKRRVLIRGSGLDVDPTFSPDGKWILFVSGRFGNPHIFRGTLKWNSDDDVRVTSDKRLTYAGWYNATPSWSPAADKIAFAGYDKDTDRFDLFMMNPDGKALERLTIRAGDNERPSWSPNGQMLVFQSNRVGGRDVKGVTQLYIMNRDGSGQRKISTGLYDAQTPQWGPAPK